MCIHRNLGTLTRVAAQVHAETIPDAMRPGLTLREALLNSSEVFGEKPVYRAWIAVKSTMKALKNRPIPVEDEFEYCFVFGHTYRRLRSLLRETDFDEDHRKSNAPTP